MPKVIATLLALPLAGWPQRTAGNENGLPQTVRDVEVVRVKKESAPANQGSGPFKEEQRLTAQAALLAGDDGNPFTIQPLFQPAAPEQTLLIHAGEPDPKTSESLKEDLAVMSRILAKSLKEHGLDDATSTAMGIRIRSLHWPGSLPSTGLPNLYLDGYGALFVLHSKIPLLPPPDKSEEKEETEARNTLWDETKRELFGQKQRTTTARVWFSGKETSKYDERKVHRMKEGIIESLKNASNIRGLKGEEFVTVVLLGPSHAPAGVVTASVLNPSGDLDVVEDTGQGTLEIARAGSKSTTIFKMDKTSGEAAGQTTLTIRAKKSDIDAWAAGEINQDQFTQRLSVRIY